MTEANAQADWSRRNQMKADGNQLLPHRAMKTELKAYFLKF
jgi:hypothetical protein